jgi:hypothetical protein
MTAIVGVIGFVLHLTVISDPNQAWWLAVALRNTFGLWWVVLVMVAFACEHALVSWIVWRSGRKYRGEISQ